MPVTLGDFTVKDGKVTSYAPDLFKKMGITSQSTDEQIRTGFRKQYLATHPDKSHIPETAPVFNFLKNIFDLLPSNPNLYNSLRSNNVYEVNSVLGENGVEVNVQPEQRSAPITPRRANPRTYEAPPAPAKSFFRNPDPEAPAPKKVESYTMSELKEYVALNGLVIRNELDEDDERLQKLAKKIDPQGTLLAKAEQLLEKAENLAEYKKQSHFDEEYAELKQEYDDLRKQFVGLKDDPEPEKAQRSQPRRNSPPQSPSRASSPDVPSPTSRGGEGSDRSGGYSSSPSMDSFESRAASPERPATPQPATTFEELSRYVNLYDKKETYELSSVERRDFRQLSDKFAKFDIKEVMDLELDVKLMRLNEDPVERSKMLKEMQGALAKFNIELPEQRAQRMRDAGFGDGGPSDRPAAGGSPRSSEKGR